jgi:hypothetical protein
MEKDMFDTPMTNQPARFATSWALRALQYAESVCAVATALTDGQMEVTHLEYFVNPETEKVEIQICLTFLQDEIAPAENPYQRLGSAIVAMPELQRFREEFDLAVGFNYDSPDGILLSTDTIQPITSMTFTNLPSSGGLRQLLSDVPTFRDVQSMADTIHDEIAKRMKERGLL